MSNLSRSEFCKVTRLSSDALASMSRRNQLPFSIDQKISGRGYSLFEAYLTIIAQDISVREGNNITRAADIAGQLPSVLEGWWPRIIAEVEKIHEGNTGQIDDIQCGRVSPYNRTQPFAVAGTEVEIAKVLASSGRSPFSRTLVSAIANLDLLVRRCQRHKVEIPADFWDAPFTYRQRPNDFEVLKSSMERVLAEAGNI